ncbi:MAG: hypothetical protein LBL59_03225 [Xanthomonadaceae bacterium]|nr:hypothetical protein [Xanthomonadaceae bacterium]
MSKIRKVPFAAGAEWVWAGIALLRKAPLPLYAIGAMGFAVMLAAALAAMMLTAGPASPESSLSTPFVFLLSIVQVMLVFGVPSLVFGGIIWAMREVDHGRRPGVGSVFKGFARPRLFSLLATLVPQFLVATLLSLLLLSMLGGDGEQRLVEVANQLNELRAAGNKPDVEQVNQVMSALPVWRILMWVVLAAVATLTVSVLVLLAIPQIVFEGRGGFSSLRRSLGIWARNVPALLLFIGLLVMALFAVAFVLNILLFVLQFLLGPAFAAMVVQLLLLTTMILLVAGSTYCAWKRLFAVETDGDTATAPPPRQVNITV